MTYHINRIGKAMTAIAAVLAFSSTPLLAQETAPPDVDTSVETPAPADTLAPEPTATETAVPPAPQPKVETTTTTTTRAERATRTATRAPARSTPRRAAAAAQAATAPASAADTPALAPLPAEPQPPVAAAPMAPPPVAEPAPAAAPDTSTFDLTSPDMLPIAGAAALGLLVLGGAGFVAHRRKRRREDAEFEARQQALAAIDDEPALELGSAEEVHPAPAFARTPIHDPVPATGLRTKIPAQGNWQPAADTDFMFRRAGEDAKAPVEQD